MKKSLFIVFVLLYSIHAQGQTDQKQPSLNNEIEDENADTTGNAENNAAGKQKISIYFFGDFGESIIKSASGGSSSSANGLTGALSCQVAYQLKHIDKINKMFVCAGIEVRTFNGAISGTDGEGVTTYDNLHYWYAGVPIIFQYINCKHKTGHLRDINYYAQAGISIGVKVMMSDFYSDDGVNTKTDISSNYNNLLLHPFVSAGVTYATKSCTFLLGPYFDYDVNNISKTAGTTTNIMSFGLRLSFLPSLNNK